MEILLPTGERTVFPSGLNTRSPVRYTVPYRLENSYENFIFFLKQFKVFVCESLAYNILEMLRTILTTARRYKAVLELVKGLTSTACLQKTAG
jgi:hypothetical protein